ncbi:MAG: WecB/TagA/CpsF family glycosyltransferase [Polaromonas sp.]|nr:WecB/TagA/CpsF family glycosyltransferase [Polaromonas sp.]
MARIRVLNAEFDALTLAQTVDAIFEDMKAGKRGWLATVNVAILMMMRSDPQLQGFVDCAALVVADGQPLIWCTRWLDRALPERVTGIDLVESICQRAAAEGKKIYLLGATLETVLRVAQRLKERHVNLQVDSADGYFGDDEAANRADAVRASKADILFVGMGVPRQERFLEQQWERLGVATAIGVGGSFDVLAGLRARAPRWVQRIGLEWLFRLLQEPRRLFMRYLVTNSQFVWLMASTLFTTKR